MASSWVILRAASTTTMRWSGNSDIAGDQAVHAFRWTRNTGIEDLGTLDGDGHSVGLGINDQGVITGISIAPDFSTLRAFVWHGGVMMDLNQLIPAKSALYLLTACSINAHGEITGFAVDSKGNLHGYLAVPVGPGEDDFEMGVSPSMLSPAARDRMRHCWTWARTRKARSLGFVGSLPGR